MDNYLKIINVMTYQINDLKISMFVENNLQLNNFTNDIYSEIDKFNILLHLSYREGLQVSLIQCLLRGKPVLCYNIRGCKDLIKHNHNGLIFELGNINAIISSICCLRG